MELIHSTRHNYRITQILYQSHKCRVSLGQDDSEDLYILNQLYDKELITRHLETLTPPLSDFKESFIYGRDFFAVFTYHPGQRLETAAGVNQPALLLEALRKLCMAAALEDLSDELLFQVIDDSCVTIQEGTVRINKRLTFPEPEPEPLTPAQKLAALLEAYISKARLDPVQALTLKPLTVLLKTPPDSLPALYAAVRDFQTEYRPMETKEILKAWREKLLNRVTAVRDKVLFYIAMAAVLTAAFLAFWNLLRPAAPEPGEFPKIGGYTLNERGSIDETNFSQEPDEKTSRPTDPD